VDVDIDTFRLVAGLVVAAVAVVVGVVVLISTDWTPPSEAQRPVDGPARQTSGPQVSQQ